VLVELPPWATRSVHTAGDSAEAEALVGSAPRLKAGAIAFFFRRARTTTATPRPRCARPNLGGWRSRRPPLATRYRADRRGRPRHGRRQGVGHRRPQRRGSPSAAVTGGGAVTVSGAKAAALHAADATAQTVTTVASTGGPATVTSARGLVVVGSGVARCGDANLPVTAAVAVHVGGSSPGDRFTTVVCAGVGGAHARRRGNDGRGGRRRRHGGPRGGGGGGRPRGGGVDRRPGRHGGSAPGAARRPCQCVEAGAAATGASRSAWGGSKAGGEARRALPFFVSVM